MNTEEPMFLEEQELVNSWIQNPARLRDIMNESMRDFLGFTLNDDKLECLNHISEFPSEQNIAYLKRVSTQLINNENALECLNIINRSHEFATEAFENLNVTRSEIREDYKELYKLVNQRGAKMNTQEIREVDNNRNR